MNIIIAGAGEIGSNLAVKLRQEGHNVTLIEKDPGTCRRVENLDILVVQGSTSDPAKLQEAGIEKADYFIAVTGSDEVNLIACTFAKFKESARMLQKTTNEGREVLRKVTEVKINRNIKTLARVNSFELMNKPMDAIKFKRLGVDMAFCPYQIVARYISNILLTPSLFTMKIFTETGVMVMEAEIKDSTPIVGMRYADIENTLDYANIAMIIRKSEVIIPKKDIQFLPGDRILILLLKPEGLHVLEQYFGRGLKQVSEEDTVKRIIILGATRIGIQLAILLMTDKSQRRHVTVIDKNTRDVEEANRVFAKLRLNVNVIQGKGNDVNLLRDNRIERTDAFVAVTAKEQANIISSLLAKRLGATRNIAIIEQENLHYLLESLPSIDTVINIKFAAVSTIFPYILSKNIESLSLIEGDAGVMEVRISRKSKSRGKSIDKLSLPSNVKIGALLRGKNPYIPGKGFKLKSGDKLIIFGKGNVITKISEIF